MKIVGTAVRRVDGVDKVTGQAKYAGDVVVPGMVEGKFLRSPYAHARILSMDTGEAERVPGVVAVLTGKDLSDGERCLGRGKRKDQPIIAIDRVLYAGQPVVAVAGVDGLSVEEALSKVHVEYEERPAVVTIQEAIADDAPQVHSFAAKNICFQDQLVKGDVAKGWNEPPGWNLERSTRFSNSWGKRGFH